VLPEFTPIRAGELRVFYARSDAHMTDPQVARCIAMLSPEERARHLRFRFEEDQRSFLAAHALTRGVLARELRTEPSALRFAEGARGRPELLSPACEPRLRFNLSHTRGMVACALAIETDVGVDVERLDRRVNIDSLSAAAFSAAERAGLEELEGEAQRHRFFELWTLKEAYIKAVGMGFALPLGAITLHVEAGRLPAISFDPRVSDDPARWFLAARIVLGEHMLAVALARPQPAEWSAQELDPFEL
jgi:4'-phosphopantetheinyl transferase